MDRVKSQKIIPDQISNQNYWSNLKVSRRQHIFVTWLARSCA